jgi:hypothetical protein
MPTLESMAYPNATIVVMDLLEGIATVRSSVPPNFDPGTELIVVRRIGGTADEDDATDRPIVQVACYGPTYPSAADLAEAVQIRILSSPLTEVNGVLVDEAHIFVGEQEVPDVYPDDRRIVSTYQLGWRRQFRP